MQLSAQTIKAKMHSFRAKGLVKLLSGNKRYEFIQTAEQAKGLKKGVHAIIYGDATLAQLRKAKSSIAHSSEVDAEFYTQANRYPNDQIASLFGKANETLSVQIRKKVIDAAEDAGARIVGVGLDGVISRGLRESKGAKNIIMVIIHHVPDKAFYLLEKWTFKKGRLQALEELNISARTFDNPIADIASSISAEITKASSSGYSFKISGVHGFTNRDANQILASTQSIGHSDAICDENDLDKPLSVFNKKFGNIEFLDFAKFTFPSPPIATDAKTKVNILRPVVIAIAGIGVYYSLVESGRSDYQQAVQEHRQAVRQIQDVYEHGTAPISLVQTRQYFMEENADKKTVFHDAVAGVFAAVSKVHSENPNARPKFENLAFNPNGLGGALGDDEFELTISFEAASEHAVLPLGYQLHQSLAESLNANTQTRDLPRKSGREGSRYSLTITGEFL